MEKNKNKKLLILKYFVFTIKSQCFQQKWNFNELLCFKSLTPVKKLSSLWKLFTFVQLLKLECTPEMTN